MQNYRIRKPAVSASTASIAIAHSRCESCCYAMALSKGTRKQAHGCLFARYTKSARRAVFYARYEAYSRGASEIEPPDILLGLARDTHHEECEFRHLHLQRESLAVSLARTWLPGSNYDAAKEARLPLSKEAKAVLAYAAQEADLTKQFWVDTDSLLIGVLLLRGGPAKSFQSLGYTLETTRAYGATGRERWPPKKPSWRARMKAYMPHWSLALLLGIIAGWLLVNTATVLLSK